MAILFSKEFGVSNDKLVRNGIFDVLIDEDSHFFINIKRLEATNVPEFIGAYDKINDYFRKIGLLLKASNVNDINYRTAIKMFNFPEVNGINLGFSSGRHGAGFGKQLRDQIIRDAYDIIKSGSEQSEIFHLTSLFEKNVGPDRLSDMVARLVYNNIIAYSKRIYIKLGITKKNYPSYDFIDGVLKNPYKQTTLLLLPLDILHEIPIAKCWDDIERVCRENEVIRQEINELIGNEWSKMTSSAKKCYLRDWIFKNPDRLNRIVDSYRATTVEKYNVFSNIDYLVGFLQNTMKFSLNVYQTSLEASLEILKSYQKWVEYHRGSLVIKAADSRSAEKTVQRTLHATALMYCKYNDLDISPEEDGGRGPVDFKISRGNDKTVIEIKLTSNRDCVHGLEIQIEEYAKTENTNQKVFVLVNTGEHLERIEAVKNKHQEMLAAGKNPAQFIIIDSRPKESASKYVPE